MEGVKKESETRESKSFIPFAVSMDRRSQMHMHVHNEGAAALVAAPKALAVVAGTVTAISLCAARGRPQSTKHSHSARHKGCAPERCAMKLSSAGLELEEEAAEAEADAAAGAEAAEAAEARAGEALMACHSCTLDRLRANGSYSGFRGGRSRDGKIRRSKSYVAVRFAAEFGTGSRGGRAYTPNRSYGSTSVTTRARHSDGANR